MKILIDTGLRFTRSAHARSAFGYLLTNVFVALIPFLLLPVLTRVMSPEAYGQYSLFLLVVSVAMPLVTLMLSSVIAREYMLREPHRFARFMTSCLLLNVLAFGLIAVICISMSDAIEAETNLAWPWIVIALLYALVQGLLAIMQSISTMQKNPRAYAAWRGGFAIATGVAAFIAVMSYKDSWQVLVQTQALVAVITLCIVLLVIAKCDWFNWQVNVPDAKMALTYSMPLVIHALTASVILQTADRFFVSHYLGVAEAGSYNVAQQVSMAMWVVVNTISQAWTPWYYEQMKINDSTAKRRIVKMTYVGFGIIALLGLVMTAVLWFAFPYLAGKAFQDARVIFPWLVLGFVFNGMYILVASGLFYAGHTWQLMLCNIATAAVNITLNMWLVPEYGMHGAAVSTMTATFCMFMFVWVVTARMYRLPWLLQ